MVSQKIAYRSIIHMNLGCNLEQGLGAVVRQAIASAPNPRNTNPAAMPQFTYRGPAIDTVCFEAMFYRRFYLIHITQETQRADSVREHMNASYKHVLEKSGGNPTLLQRPKLGTKPSAINKPEAQVFVKVK